MKPASFLYHRPTSVEEAVTLLEDHGGTARVLAGGQSLVPMLNMRLWRPGALVDINEIDQLTSVGIEGEDLLLGALVRYTTIEQHPLVAERARLLAMAVRHIGDRQVRNRGTVGGSLVHADPTGEVPLVGIVLDARVRVVGPRGHRELPVRDLYTGPYATVLAPDELLTAVVFPPSPDYAALAELCRKHNDFAVVSAAAAGTQAPDGTWSDLRLAVAGATDRPTLIATDEADGRPLDRSTIQALARATVEVIDPPTDIRASAEYRSHMTAVYVQRVLEQLRDSATSSNGAHR